MTWNFRYRKGLNRRVMSSFSRSIYNLRSLFKKKIVPFTDINAHQYRQGDSYWTEIEKAVTYMGRRIFSRSLLLPVATPTTPSQLSLTPRLPYLLLYGVFVKSPPFPPAWNRFKYLARLGRSHSSISTPTKQSHR